MIARAESGQARDNMTDFDAAEVAHGIHELYEPLAEDRGLTLAVKADAAIIHGNRELIARDRPTWCGTHKYGRPRFADGAQESAGPESDRGAAAKRRRSSLVTDLGPGIGGRRSRAVERFVSMELRTKPGSGLGLSMAVGCRDVAWWRHANRRRPSGAARDDCDPEPGCVEQKAA